MPPTPDNKWLTVTVTCPARIVEAVADQLGAMSGVGVEITPESPAGTQEVTGFFPLETDGAQTIEERSEAVVHEVTETLAELFAIYGFELVEPVLSIIEDQDWATSWQQFFSTFEIVPGLVIQPSWEEYTPLPGQKVIRMDPGMAFGTGQHASTRLALTLLSECFADEKTTPSRVLDIGTGTGILAMAAALKGADNVLAIDNDPDAVTIARQNILTNHLDWNIGVSTTPLEKVTGGFDLVCANIVHDVLAAMTPEIARLTFPRGRIILAGILAGDQETSITDIYTNHGMTPLRTLRDEEWAALLLRRK
ncbi:MAG: 50S ribosomal protein L11 methyltransferase [Desulfobulbaceae bacterium]